MRKKAMGKMLILLSSMLILGACNGPKATENMEDTIDGAIEKNQALENGRFATEITMQTDADHIVQSSEGTFIKIADEQYDWYHKNFFPGESGGSHELVELDGQQFQKTNINANTGTEWMEVAEPTTSFQGATASLFKNNLVESEIKERQIKEQADGTQYILTLDAEVFGERVKAENKEEIQGAIDELEENNANADQIHAMNLQLMSVDAMEYQDVVVTYEINEEDFLSAVSFEATILPAEGESYNLLTNVTLTEYNLPDTEDLLPQVN